MGRVNPVLNFGAGPAKLPPEVSFVVLLKAVLRAEVVLRFNCNQLISAVLNGHRVTSLLRENVFAATYVREDAMLPD